MNLEIASHRTEGEARERVETAQSVTKLLLGDVRGVVSALREKDILDLPAALVRDRTRAVLQAARAGYLG